MASIATLEADGWVARGTFGGTVVLEKDGMLTLLHNDSTTTNIEDMFGGDMMLVKYIRLRRRVKRLEARVANLEAAKPQGR